MRHLILMILMSFIVMAASSRLACADDLPDTKEIVEKLKPKAPKSKDRSWPTKNDRGVKVEGGTPLAPEPASIDLQVNFDYKSAQLSTDAQLILNRLGRALTDPTLSSQRFKLTGHTDNIGGEAYNLDLSKRRANSVKNYLVQNLNLNPARLDTEGKGFAQLADVANPASGINRRVQVTNLGK